MIGRDIYREREWECKRDREGGRESERGRDGDIVREGESECGRESGRE